MIRRFALALSLAALAACSPPQSTEAPDAVATAAVGPGDAVAQTPAQAPEGAEAAITAWARERFGGNLIEPVAIFYGDFTGDGAPDALMWADYDSGGSSAMHDVALFRNEAGRMTFWRRDETVYGSQPSNVQITSGRITLTTVMPRAGDPHCCPTGSQDWTIDAN